jgi:hypothetical protein
MNLKRRILNILIGLDQFLFCLVTLGNAYPDETLSAAAWRWELTGRWQGRLLRPLIDLLFFFDPEHCRKSFESEVQKAHLPAAYRPPL